MSKTDNTRQIVIDIKAAVLDINNKSELVLSNDDIGEVRINDIFAQYIGKEIDFKIGGFVKISSNMFDGEDEK